MATIRFNAQFPGYEVLSELGRSNARILKARHIATGDLVAIKHFALNTDDDTLRRFQRESAIMTSINHPNVVKVREVQLEADLPYIVMELIEGGSLRNLIKTGGHLDVPTTIRLGLQMASAFKAIHPQGIIHRDIKPENILYRPLPSGELHFLLTDFGVARLREQSTTMTGQSLMTYEYASPEQFNDPRGVGVATDYYSLGVVLFECLNGSVPFQMGDQSGIVTFMNKVLNDAPPALTVAPNGQPLGRLVDLIQGLLLKKPDERLNDADELTWLLKQAELDYLQASRTGQFTNRPTTPLIITQPVDVAPQPKASLPTEPAEVPNAPRSARARESAGSGSSFKWIGLILLALAVAAGGYYIVRSNSASEPGAEPPSLSELITGSADSDSTTSGDETNTAEVDSVALRLQQEAEERQRREKLRQEAVAAGRNLRVDVSNYRTGLLGGIRDAEITLSNPSNITFPAIAVQVKYIKENGDTYKTEKIFFMNVGPDATLSKRAPDSDRGTRITCRVLKYDLPTDVLPIDSAATDVPGDSTL
ncbi:serine/threonine protein kinase, bacterial [Fibrisoma limi BUZ 3]|uniref:Serine/threonine protein kinase, bacterial n=1 Tax=Fibrisoma limi BUZ 3 TaxID=1185876 RepID=I2GTF1_9BACT|nr:serine/threonine-protein kinase [Fibrisoma limi]CCH57180.1 serine/threonine protein kinase, bacterial [Fibrisoma limi BUZ 3]